MSRTRTGAAFGLVAFVTALALAAAPGAHAHPLGNFSVNHVTQVSVSSDRVEARYTLDQAEVPTFQERNLAPAEVLARKRAIVERGLELKVNGAPLKLRPAAPAVITFPQGQGGLKLTRIELPLVANVSNPRKVELVDNTFEGRVGWAGIVARPGDRTAVRSTVPSGDPTNGLRSYPEEALQSPLDQRYASLSVRPGGGTLTAPEAPGSSATKTTESHGEDGFSGVFSDAASGEGVLLLLLLAAFGWGAMHALSPGHGKAMVAAYLIGTRGTAKHAVGLGAIVTFTHTIGVFALGFVTLLLSQYILPEDLYPWLNLAAGLLVVTVGLAVLRSRVRWGQAHRAHARHHEHGHSHSHSHDVPERVTWKGLVGMGTAAGLIPCPSALVVLLGAIAQHEVGLGMVLITAFSLGLAATLTGLGLAVVYAKRATSRLAVPPRLTAVLPAASAVLIVGIGFVLTAQAIPDLG